MTDQDAPNSEEISTQWQEVSPSVESVMPGFNLILKINHGVRALILDYTLAAAIIGLIPIYSSKWADVLGFVALGLLNLKMMRDIGVRWGQLKGQDAFAITSSFLSVLGAFGIAIILRLIVSTIGLFIPLIIVLNRAVGHATLTWALGRAANQFYLSTKRINSSTLEQVLQIHKTDQKKRPSKQRSFN